VLTSAERSLYRAESLHSERELELPEQAQGFFDDLAAIDPPSQPTVDKAIALAEN
jgi:hypothetical protein